MDSSSHDHVWTSPRDWLRLRPPSPSSSLSCAVDLEDNLSKLTYPNTPFDGDILSVNRDERIIGFAAQKPISFNDDNQGCHTLVENIQNSSLLLIASHSSESDRLVEADVQALLSVIDNLSNYLMDRAGIPASCIQAAIQPVKDYSGSNSRICEKVFRWTEENNAEDYEMQASTLYDKCCTSRGIHFVEGGRCSKILAKSQGTDSKKMGKVSGHEKDKCLERRLSELQKQVMNLREDFGFDLKERSTAIHFYKNLLSESQATLSIMMSEMEHITELELLKKNKFRTGGLHNFQTVLSHIEYLC